MAEKTNGEDRIFNKEGSSLSKREAFALEAMKAILSNGRTECVEDAVQSAVFAADHLILTLNGGRS